MRSIEVVVMAEEACGYLETVLQMEAGFQVTTCGMTLPGDALRADLVMVELDATLPGAEAALQRVLRQAGMVPVVVVSRWSPGLGPMNRLMRAGAEDVLVLAELNAERLTAAVFKALERRARWGLPSRRRASPGAFAVPLADAVVPESVAVDA